MCGIAGGVGWEGSAQSTVDRLDAMCEALAHRGPDDRGHFTAPGIALGMRRLSVIDVEHGQQPITNEDGSIVAVFNGEIYNHRALRSELRAMGHAFTSASDSEVLVHLYEERGYEMLRALDGMFAFALWDAKRSRLVLARDRIGIKPLYYWPQEHSLSFASELRAFLATPDFPRHLSQRAVAEYLALGYIPDRSCIFAAARKLPAAHYLTWTRGEEPAVRAYWSPFVSERRGVDERELMEELRLLLGTAVASQLEADVPVGAFLSGGIDSSTVVAHMVRAASGPVRTFTIGFDEVEHDETARAKLVADALGTRHSALVLRPDAESLIDDVAGLFDEPFGDSCALALYMISQFARRAVTVVLSGDGGDELFAGYSRYSETMRGRSVPLAALRKLTRGVVRRTPLQLRGRNFLLNAARRDEGRYASTVALSLREDEGGVATSELAAYLPDMDALLSEWFSRSEGRDFVSQMTLVDIMTYLPGDILTMVDRTSMAVSLEARVPLLDHRLVEFAVSLAGSFKLRDGTGKWLLREAAAGLLPPEVLKLPKVGLSLPLESWFRGPLRHHLTELASPNARIAEFVSSSAVRHALGEHMTGRRDHSGMLWRLLALERWLRALDCGTLARANRASSALDAAINRAMESR